MIPLIFSILSSAFIFVIFKVFPKLKVDTFQAIVFNYITAFSCGFLLYHEELTPDALSHLEWLPFMLLCGILFISLFLIMGKSSQQNGVAMTSVSVKMSMAISMLMMVFAYDESMSFLKIGGIVLAVLGVYFMSSVKNKNVLSNQKPVVWMLLVLFIGSGLLDFLINYVQKTKLEFLPTSLFSAFGFGTAGIIGIFILIFNILRKKTTFHYRNILAGILLGIPNYFSIYLFMLSYSTTGWSDSTVLVITNVSVVLLSAIIGFSVFRESFHFKKFLGLLFAVSAIVLLYFAST
jgi:drug/metabolite transporter (DMT)-like permease